MHMCPMVTPGLPPIPHVGGPITGPGCPTVLIGGLPAAVMGDMCVCVGPPDTIILGSTGVFIGGKPAARMGDQTAHGGVISLGFPTVLIGETGGGGGGSAMNLAAAKQLEQAIQKVPKALRSQLALMQQKVTLLKAAADGVPFCEECAKKAARG